MTKRELLSMALKVVGLWFAVIYGCEFLGELTGRYMWTPSNLSYAVMPLVMTFAFLVLSLALMRWSDWLARRLMPGADDNVVWAEITRYSSVAPLIAMKLLGFVMVLSAIRYLGFWLSRDSFDGLNWGSQFLGTAVICFLAGGYLFFGGKALARLIAVMPADPGAPAPGQNDWEKRIFALAVRIIGVAFLTWYLPWFLKVLILQWLKAPILLTTEGADVKEAVRGFISLALCLYLIVEANHLTHFLFRTRKSREAAPSPGPSDSL